MISCFNVFLGCVSYGMHGGWRPSIKNWGVLVNKSPFICLHFLFCFSFQLNSVTVTMHKPTYLTIRSKTLLFFWKFVLSCLVKCRILYADICSWISCFVLFCYNGFFSALVKEEISEISVWPYGNCKNKNRLSLQLVVCKAHSHVKLELGL